MSNSSLVDYIKYSPNHSGRRNHKIDTITIHCVVGQCSVETLGNIFANPSLEASSNYGVGYDGRIGLYVDEANRSWCSSSGSNDNRAITIEVASDTYHPYAVNDKAYNATVKLVADICHRNGIKKLMWRADSSLIGQVDKQNMTVHRWFANKSCPGDYLYKRMGDIANRVNELLGSSADNDYESDDNTPTSNGSSDIEVVQDWLNDNYDTGLDIDGIYGSLTKSALVKALQTELNKQCGAGLDVDGIFGWRTRAAIVNLYSGVQGNLTKTLQGLLICNGYDTNGFDGIFGAGTAHAVQQYQSDQGLYVDGIAGKDTFERLCS